MTAETASIARWIDENTTGLEFGELQIVLKIHDGKIALIERSKTERIKTKPDTRGVSYGKH